MYNVAAKDDTMTTYNIKNVPNSEDIKEMTHKVSEAIDDAIGDARHNAEKELAGLEKKICESPLQSIGIAFAAGLLVSYLLKRG